MTRDREPRRGADPDSDRDQMSQVSPVNPVIGPEFTAPRPPVNGSEVPPGDGRNAGSPGRGRRRRSHRGHAAGDPKTRAGAGASGASGASGRAGSGGSGRSGSGGSGRSGSGNARNRAHPRRRLRQVDEFSAGGLVLDLTGEIPRGALIGRTDRQGRLLWSLPKGHIEAGETAEQAAVREVEEETGIAGTIVAELGTIDFWFVAEGRRIHKTVRHYLMRRTGGELSDADIEVDEVAWVPLPDIRAQLAYPDERGLVDTAGRLLADTA